MKQGAPDLVGPNALWLGVLAEPAFDRVAVYRKALGRFADVAIFLLEDLVHLGGDHVVKGGPLQEAFGCGILV